MEDKASLLRGRRTKIVSTLGPASSTKEMIQTLFFAGVDVFRLNFSHGTHEEQAARYHIIRELEKETGKVIGVLADIQGPKLRVGNFADGKVILKTGAIFRLDLDKTLGNEERVCLPHPEIINSAEPGCRLLLDDGKLCLIVRKVGKDFLETEVLVGGPLSNHKGVNVPDMILPIPALTEKDHKDLKFALELGVDFIGLSFVQRPEDVQEAKDISNGRAWIVTKMEKPQAMQNIDAILELTDGVMVARGDLGVEMPPEEVPLAQIKIIRKARQLGKPVIVATQMLESMISSPTPTRAEASDIATAVFEGADAVMLSAESAAGQYPKEAVTIMDRIISRVEKDEEWRKLMEATREQPHNNVADAIVAAAQKICNTLETPAVVAFTRRGKTAQRMSRERPDSMIFGVTPTLESARKLALVWGVHPYHSITVDNPACSVEDMVAEASRIVQSYQVVTKGDHMVVIAGMPFGQAGSTNLIRVVDIQ
ncbi:Pyruvate kinase (PykF) (PDB:6QXL) [Commensalibacter communis]|uniref:Pyruvate kinase n=1 Tax=Commensalibacter communis TaxID=2972786 RepID=A0A9W4X6W2_9PROT|nr:pyruvate kinase [Commensalibacter communis]CAI3938377.1 Pyruvate kinase (PykF) (PDB:6QXL) [Commensalibacter communis]CAI3938576.1 Pyruvate kinase (PykF) (PDB:6QXL) [Commensalibacter communis]CAI3939849.1 Pyruvate kinase (PykF) (PDB:6QXL) [Commensalibacter communis]CAI3941731.1 Pyruvate kinase (PykF) (PDB:6QXL) [Commensalibacter communis]CAI3941764.1 Pyruvate kinase (PykF) (PDB:6QXL) [Commensalibacter communis]